MRGEGKRGGGGEVERGGGGEVERGGGEEVERGGEGKLRWEGERRERGPGRVKGVIDTQGCGCVATSNAGRRHCWWSPTTRTS